MAISSQYFETRSLSRYLKLVSQYSRAVGVNLAEDLSPPKDLYIEVRLRKRLWTVI